MIIYFTGTGNSRFLAKLLGEQLGDKVIDAAALIKENRCPVFRSDAPLVFVAPAYAWRLPRLFEEWIGQCAFEGDRRAYFVMNCGSSIGGAGSYAKKLCRKKGLNYMGIAGVVMPENYIAVFSAPDETKCAGIIAKARDKAAGLGEIIRRQEPFAGKGNSLPGYLCSSVVNNCFYAFTISSKKFYATDACISCGQCVDNCMLNNIALKGGRPVWGMDCTHCMACICRCPAGAIEYGRHSRGLRRYVCPEE